MKYIKKYENNIPRVLGVTITNIDSLREILNSANDFGIKTNIYVSKSKGINDSVVIFPDIYKDNKIKIKQKYSNFINNKWELYSWYSIKYIENTFILIDENDIELYLNANKYGI